MSLVALDGTPLILLGAIRLGQVFAPGTTTIVQDAVNEACIMIGQLFWEDGVSHTINTTGSSSIGWQSGTTVTFANAGTTFKVGIAEVDATTGPAARAVNSSDVITFDVSKSYTSAAPVAADSWMESVPDSGTKTIAHGDLIAICTQITARGGVDVIETNTCSAGFAGAQPAVTSFTGATYTNVTATPNCAIRASDGTYGFLWGAMVASPAAAVVRTWGNSSTPKEYGNIFQAPFPLRIYGIVASCNVSGNVDFVGYSNPLGSPVAERTVSIDLNSVGRASITAWLPKLFSAPYDLAANQPFAAIVKPTSATTVDLPYISMNISAHQKAYPFGTNCYAISRNTGVFAAQNANKDRYGIALLAGAFDSGGGGGGSFSAFVG